MALPFCLEHLSSVLGVPGDTAGRNVGVKEIRLPVLAEVGSSQVIEDQNRKSAIGGQEKGQGHSNEPITVYVNRSESRQ